MKCAGVTDPLDSEAVNAPTPNTAATKYTKSGIVCLHYVD